jgi:gas vesicle protein
MRSLQVTVSEKSLALAFAIGFVIGIGSGISAAFLLTPVSGKEAVNILKDTADDVKVTVKEAVGDRKKIYTETWKQPQVKPYV